MFGINLGNLVVHLSANATQFEKTLKSAEQRLTATSKKFKAIGRSMSLYITAPLTAIGGFSLKVFGDFNQAMTESLAIMGEVSQEMRQQMGDMARSIARGSITSAKDLAEGYFFLASAGMDAIQSIGALGAVERFAVAGAFDMAKATDLLTDALSALGLSSKDAAKNQANLIKLGDVLVKANTLANASVEQFSEALTNKAATAIRMLNKDMEEGVAVLAAFADRGKKGVAAGEFLNIMSRDLQTASIKNTAAWKKMGMTVFDVQGKMLPYADIIAQLERRFSSLTDQQKKMTAAQLGFQDRSFAAIQMLIGTSDQIRVYEKALRSAGGITEEVAEKQLKSFNSQMKILWNNVKDVAITIGNILAPGVLRLNEYIRQGVVYWNALSEKTQKFIVVASVVASVLGPVFLGLGFVVGMAGALVASFSALFAAATTVIGVMSSLWVVIAGGAVISLTPLGAVALGVAVIAASVIGLIALLVGKDGLKEAWGSMEIASKSFFTSFLGFMVNLSENMSILTTWMAENWSGFLVQMGKELVNMVVRALGRIGLVATTAFNLIFTSLTDAFRNNFEDDIDKILSEFMRHWKIINDDVFLKPTILPPEFNLGLKDIVDQALVTVPFVESAAHAAARAAAEMRRANREQMAMSSGEFSTRAFSGLVLRPRFNSVNRIEGMNDGKRTQEAQLKAQQTANEHLINIQRALEMTNTGAATAV